MARIPKSLLITWIVTALAAIVMWLLIPGSRMDRAAAQWLARGFGKGSVIISGSGIAADPWKLRSNPAVDVSELQPTTVALMDDLEGIFQSSPHSPIDLAVIFKNLRDLGTRQLACSVLLAWEDPDPISLTAMESALLEFDSVVLAIPVTRGAIMNAMPPDLRRASLPTQQLGGDSSLLPTVNRASVPTLIHGGENAMAGFEVIDSEPSAQHIHLMARWDERVIFSFPVLAALQHLGLKPEDLIIELGSHLQLGKAGPAIPIDEFGRLAIDKAAVMPETDMQAKELIDARAGDEGLAPLEQVTLCDLRSHADIDTRDFNRMIPYSMAVLMRGQSRATEMTMARLNSACELPILLALALLMSLATLLDRRAIGSITLIAIGALALSVWFGFRAGIWPPAFEAFLVIMAALACSSVCVGRRKRTTSMPRMDRLKLDSTQDQLDPPL